MNDRDQRRYARFVRVQTFGKANLGDFTPGGIVAGEFASLDEKIRQIDAAKAEQTPSRVSKATLLDALLLDFKAISRTARAINAKEPGIAAGFEVPQPLTEATTRTHADALLARLEDRESDTAAQKTAKAALRAKFVAYELPADFVADLRADLDALTKTGESNQTETLQGVESTAELDKLLTECTAIAQQLDTGVRNRYARTPEKLAAWQSANHVERSPQRAKASANTNVSAPAANPTPANTVPATT